MKKILIGIILATIILSGCTEPEQVPQEPDLIVPELGLSSQEACSSYKFLGSGGTQYFYNHLGVDQNLFWEDWGLLRYGSTRIVGERTSLGHTVDTREERMHECYYEMLRVCDSDFVCQDYSKRFLVVESELDIWCDGQCFW